MVSGGSFWCGVNCNKLLKSYLNPASALELNFGRGPPQTNKIWRVTKLIMFVIYCQTKWDGWIFVLYC